MIWFRIPGVVSQRTGILRVDVGEVLMLSPMVRPRAGDYLAFDLRDGTVWRFVRVDSDVAEEHGTWTVERLESDRTNEGDALVQRNDDGTVVAYLAGTCVEWSYASWAFESGFHRTRADASASVLDTDE